MCVFITCKTCTYNNNSNIRANTVHSCATLVSQNKQHKEATQTTYRGYAKQPSHMLASSHTFVSSYHTLSSEKNTTLPDKTPSRQTKTPPRIHLLTSSYNTHPSFCDTLSHATMLLKQPLVQALIHGNHSTPLFLTACMFDCLARLQEFPLPLTMTIPQMMTMRSVMPMTTMMTIHTWGRVDHRRAMRSLLTVIITHGHVDHIMHACFSQPMHAIRCIGGVWRVGGVWCRGGMWSGVNRTPSIRRKELFPPKFLLYYNFCGCGTSCGCGCGSCCMCIAHY